MKLREKQELHHKSAEELQKMVLELQNEIIQDRFDHQRGKLKDVKMLSKKRKSIAQILSIMKGKELSAK